MMSQSSKRRTIMPDELRFSAKLLSNLRLRPKQVRPGLRLSKAALETPLPKGILRDIRDFLTRSGRWTGHPIDSVEAFVAMPAIGVSMKDPVPEVIGLREPVFTSVGFGMEGIQEGVVQYSKGVCEAHNSDSKCDTYVCITHATKPGVTRRPATEIAAPEACFDSHCEDNTCHDDRCSSQHCNILRCPSHSCTVNECNTQRTTVSLTAELEAQWKHPFVKELGRYFGVDMGDKLAKAVMHYVGRNMFDESAR
jgi:hypothetical protein